MNNFYKFYKQLNFFSQNFKNYSHLQIYSLIKQLINNHTNFLRILPQKSKVVNCELQSTLKSYKDKNYLANSEKNTDKIILRDCCSEEQATALIIETHHHFIQLNSCWGTIL